MRVLYLGRSRKDCLTISIAKFVTVRLGVADHVGDNFIFVFSTNHFAAGRAYNLFCHLDTPNSSDEFRSFCR